MRSNHELHKTKSIICEYGVDIVKLDLLAFQKISKRHFLRDIEKSCQEVTSMGPEPRHFFSF